ncbi:MAG: methionine--tRNA ligase, partial [Planctomycetia bacterium]|nr:methionine--tRNA ligase [Planctomycetia bacterium]
DVQARYRRMEGFDVFFLMGNDENTVKVSKRAAELGQDTQAYCNDMARQFREVWDALDISYDTFIQTSSERHKQCCRKFIQKVYDNGHIVKDKYQGWYCEGCEEFKTEKDYKENNGLCPNHNRPLIRREEDCYLFKLSTFQDRLLAYYKENPDFIQPESRRNELISLIENEGLRDVNITRTGEDWGIRVPFDDRFTIYVWFDALLTYITGIGYGDDRATFDKYWPADIHFIGKDITRFHCALWPAMLWAAGEAAPREVFGHGFVYLKLPGGKLDDKSDAADRVKIGKTTLKELGLEYLAEPMEIIKKFSAESFRYYFLRECPFPSDGEFSPERFVEVYNSELANNLGNLFSRGMNLVWKNFGGVYEGTAGKTPEPVSSDLNLPALVTEVRGHVEACRYNLALQKIVVDLLTPINGYIEKQEPWKLVKTDKEQAKRVLFNAVQSLRIASILLKPFIPRSAEKIYTSFNFPKPWAEVKYADAAELKAQPED